MPGIPQEQLEELRSIDTHLEAIEEDVLASAGVDLAPIIGAITAGFAAIVEAINALATADAASDAAILAAIAETNRLLGAIISGQTEEQATTLGLAGGTVVDKPPQP